MALSIELKRRAAQTLRRLHGPERARLVRRMREVAEDPTGKGCEPLAGSPGYWKARVGGWRLVYRWDQTTLYVELIATRGQVYRDFRGR